MALMHANRSGFGDKNFVVAFIYLPCSLCLDQLILGILKCSLSLLVGGALLPRPQWVVEAKVVFTTKYNTITLKRKIHQYVALED